VTRSQLVSSRDELSKLSLALLICRGSCDCGASRVVEVVVAARRC
jgi:hypothetical protein